MSTASVPVPQYHTDLRAPIKTAVGPDPHVKMHRAEIEKVHPAGGAHLRWRRLFAGEQTVLVPAAPPARAARSVTQPHPAPPQTPWTRPQVRAGLPVEINPSVGSGYKVMDWTEYFGRFKASPEFPECLACGGANTKEHYFTQVRLPGHQHTRRACWCATVPASEVTACVQPSTDFALPAPHHHPVCAAAAAAARRGAAARSTGSPRRSASTACSTASEATGTPTSRRPRSLRRRAGRRWLQSRRRAATRDGPLVSRHARAGGRQLIPAHWHKQALECLARLLYMWHSI